MSQDPLVGNTHSFKKLRGYVEYNLDHGLQRRLFIEPFVHQTMREHLLCVSVSVLGPGVMEMSCPAPASCQYSLAGGW